ncbi:hypothetical protein PCANC_28159 [Puccinia coronata f. sp. avenae]|uniref:Integrase catalytic domain-containing protein n=1 Tax=Puccinia coronata f. sp. avenae TaxID=200324 RepID=A0A2N5S1Y3_9BASI|nr:hypothetical protein PCANC_28159 [Puccinia coronata f. sp. avenae]
MLSYCMEKNLDGFLTADKAATATTDALKEAWTDKKTSAAGIIGRHLSEDNTSRFITDENRREPHIIWEALHKHFESSSSQNQAKVYQKFLKVGYHSNLRDFLTQVENSISNMQAVGLKIKVPAETEPDVNETLLAEHIVSLLPSSFNHTKEIIFTKRPLTLKKIRDHLEAKSLDSEETTSVKIESANKAQTPSNYCTNGKHNPSARHKKERCYELYPHIKLEDEAKKKEKEKPKSVAKAASTRATSPEPESDNDNASVISHPTAYYAVGRALHTHRPETGPILLDSGCSDHMFANKSVFLSYKPMKSLVEIADGQTVPIVGSGYVQIKNFSGGIHAFKAVHVPSLSHPLISFGRLWLKGCSIVRVSTDKFSILDPTSTITLFDGIVKGKVFSIRGTILRAQGQSPISSSFKASQANAEELHRRAGHPNGEALKRMFGVNYNTMTCESCRLSKSQRLPFSGKLPEATSVLNFIYMDLSGKITPMSTGGGQYYLKITDAFSSYKHVFILSCKSQAFEKFKSYCKEVQNFHSSRIKNVVTDGGGEFCSAEFEKFYEDEGIIHHITAPYTPQQNSIAERGNRTTSEKARALLKQANLPSKMWGKRAYINIPKEKRNGKFGDTSKRGILVGYRQGIRNWRVLTEGTRVEYSHDVVFDDSCFPGISPSSSADTRDFIPFDDEEDTVEQPASSNTQLSISGSSPSPELLQRLRDASHPTFYSPPSPFLPFPGTVPEKVPSLSLTDQGEGAQRQSVSSNAVVDVPSADLPAKEHPAQSVVSPSAQPKPSWSWVPADQPAPKTISSDINPSNIVTSKRRAQYANQLLTDQPYFEPIFAMAVTPSTSPSVPKTYRSAMSSPEAAKWSSAIKLELDAMVRLGVWTVVPIPSNRHLLGTIWVFRKKYDANGNLMKFKARLCAQGSAQQEGIDFNKTYAPTGRSSVLKTALTVGINAGMDIHQMDVCNTFLNGKLDEEIYLCCPSGFDTPDGFCLKLNKSIYGLKQAPRVWYTELTTFFSAINFVASPADPCLFISREPGWECLVHVYVDDMAIISHDVARFKKLVSDRFLMDDLGPANSLLGMKITRHDKFLTLSQERYVSEILDEYNLSACRTVPTPMIPNTRLEPASEAELAKPGIVHWRAFLHLLRYLSGTKDYSIRVGGGDGIFRIYTDANWANCSETRRSYSGYLVTWGDSILAWKAKKQATVSTSTTEAEYRALYDGVQEAVWLQSLMSSITGQSIYPIGIFTNNLAALALSKNPLANQRTKHIDVKYHFIQEAVDKKWVTISYVATAVMPADGLTKSLANPKHSAFLSFLKMKIRQLRS